MNNLKSDNYTSVTEEFTKLFNRLKELTKSLPLNPDLIKKLNDENRLKSALFSARIEGNPLTWEEIKKEISEIQPTENEIVLLPRRQEILAIIKDHNNVSFDFIKRNFFGTPARTLSYDLKKLADQGLIVKVGKTRGSFYRIKENI